MATLTEHRINCLDLKEQHQLLKTELMQAFGQVIDQTAFSGGPFVEEFEKNLQHIVKQNIQLVLAMAPLRCIWPCLHWVLVQEMR